LSEKEPAFPDVYRLSDRFSRRRSMAASECITQFVVPDIFHMTNASCFGRRAIFHPAQCN
jgi:hypothetical protein